MGVERFMTNGAPDRGEVVAGWRNTERLSVPDAEKKLSPAFGPVWPEGGCSRY
jgi:hypothetical protein